ncbi:MAG: hypothetical protein ACMXX7_00715 [Candidatus Woesearchaeota archaeon]
MKFTKLSLLILVSFLTLSLAYAQIDVNVEPINPFFLGASEARPTICACGTFIDEITIRNNARFASSYTFSSNSDFVTNPQPILLRPGEEKKLSLVLAVPCSQRPTIDQYNLRVSDSFGNIKELSRTLEVQRCASIDFSIESVESINPCQPMTFNANITNIAPFSEEFILRALNYNEYFKDDTFYFSLAPGQKGTASMQFTLACELFGEKEIEFEVESLNNKLSSGLVQKLEVNRFYDFSLNTTANVEMCVEDGLTQNVEIVNEADVKNTYDLFLQRNRGIANVDSPLVVEGNSQNITNLNINPSNPGTYNISLFATSRLGGFQANKDVIVNALKCYDFSLELVSDNNYCSGDNEIIIKIENKGIFEEDFVVKANLFEYLIFNQTISLQQQESKYVSIPVNFEDYNSNLLVDIRVTSNGIEKSLNKNIVVKDLFACTLPKVESIRFFRYFEQNISLSVENTGFKSANYTLNYTNNIEGPKSIFLEAGESKQIYLTHGFNKSFLGLNYFNLTLSTQDFDYEKKVSMFVRGDTYTQRFIDFLSLYWLIILLILFILLILLLLLLFLIRWVSSKYVYKKPGLIRSALLILALLFLLFVLLFSVQHQINPKTGEFVRGENPLLVINSDYLLNLSNYFIDPDGGQLTYSVVDLPLIEYILINDSMLLIPGNFTGNTSMIVSAKDEAGEFVNSPSFLITVYEKRNITWELLFKYYSWLIYAIIFLVIALLIYLTPVKKKVKK